VIVLAAKVASKGTKAPEALPNLNSTAASILAFEIPSLFNNLTFSLKAIVGFTFETTLLAPFAGIIVAIGAIVSGPLLKLAPSAVKLSNRLFPTKPPAPC